MSSDRPKRIRITGPENLRNMTIGKVYDVSRWSGDGPWVVNDKGVEWICAHHGEVGFNNVPEWEPADDAPEPKPATFKVGDRVRVKTGPEYGIVAGREGCVACIDSCGVVWFDGEPHNPDWLERVDPTPVVPAAPTMTVAATILDGSPIYVVKDKGGHEIAHGSLPDIEAAIKAIDAFRARVAAGLDS